MKTFKEFINENLTDMMVSKDDNEILNSIKKLEPNEMLIKSIKHDFVDGVRLALSEYADPSFMHNILFDWSCECGYDDILKLCLKDDRVKITEDLLDGIRYAKDNGHKNIVRLLLNDIRYEKLLTSLQSDYYKSFIKGKLD